MNTLRSLLIIAAAAVQAVIAFFPELVGIEGSVGAMAEIWRTPLVPAGWAFSIWSVLFTLLAIFAVHHWRRRKDPRMAAAGWLLLPALVGNAVFVWHQPTFGPDAVSFVILETILLFAVLAALKSREVSKDGVLGRIALAAPFALAGWIAVATAPGLSLALRVEGLLTVEPDPVLAMVPVLAAFAPFVLFLAWLMRSWVFAAPVLWGLFGVAAVNGDAPILLVTLVVIAAGVLGVTALAMGRRPAGQPSKSVA